MTLQGATDVLSDQACDSFAKVTLIVGANDSQEGTFVYDMTESLTQLILQAKAITGNGEVRVSSMLQCIVGEKTQLIIEQLNSSVEDVCKKPGITFIENDTSFRLGNSDVNEGFLNDDRYSLNAGYNKLQKCWAAKHSFSQ